MAYARRIILEERSSVACPCTTLIPFTGDAEFNHDDTIKVWN